MNEDTNKLSIENFKDILKSIDIDLLEIFEELSASIYNVSCLDQDDADIYVIKTMVPSLIKALENYKACEV